MKLSIKARDMTKKSTWLALLLLSILFFSLSPILERRCYSNSISAKCLPSFPYKDGWYGGDAAYSIRLDEKRTLWLFGDTFVSSEEGRQDRMDMNVVLGTTLAISTCLVNAEFKIQYYLKKKNGEFISSFGENDWLWPQDPFMVHNTLYVPLLVVEAKPEIKGPFKFKVVGHKIAKIKNFEGMDPNKWIIDYIDLTPGIPQSIIAFATTSVVYKNYVYYYPLYTSTKDTLKIFGNILARIPINKLNDPAKAIEYFTKDGIWEKGLDPAQAKIVLGAGVSELSVKYHADDKKWIAVYMSTRNNGEQLLYQVADRPEGPWTEPMALIETIPEVDPKSPQYDKNNFCYAGKEHIEFAQERNLVITYVCNSFEDFQKKTNFIRKNLFLYRPIVKNISHFP
jgi:Domain of unknown function (DUF4185)